VQNNGEIATVAFMQRKPDERRPVASINPITPR